MDPAFQIVAGRAQVAQFLRLHHLIGLGGLGNLGLFGGDVLGVDFGQLRLARGDVEGQFIIEVERLFIKDIKAFDILQQRVFMGQKIGGDLVDLGLHVFVFRDELGKGRGAAHKLFPPAGIAAQVHFIDRKAADRGDDVAQAVACGADILVLHVLQHGLTDHLQF